MYKFSKIKCYRKDDLVQLKEAMMNILRIFMLSLLVMVGCVEVKDKVWVNADGSGRGGFRGRDAYLPLQAEPR